MTTRRGLLQAAALSPLAALAQGTGESRNKQAGMAYRRLGRTGMMVSEIVSGGDPIRAGNYQHLDLALEMGLNYLDMAPAYGNGDCETSYGKLLGGSAKRGKVFLATKISAFGPLRNRLYKEIFDGLAADRKEAVAKRAAELRLASVAEKPGYFVQYYPGQKRQLEPTFLSLAMMPDYAHRVEGSQEFRKAIRESLEGSLKRVGTDHFDIVMCPHGACMKEELNNPHIHESFLELKKEGKVRFLGVSSHNDPAAVLRRAAELGHYDVAMVAYNLIIGPALEQPILDAAAKGMGLIAMKAAHAVASHHKEMLPIPQWRIDLVNRVVPGDWKPPLKAYLWALQNPRIAAVNSNLWNETMIRENLALAGRKVELQAA